MARKRDETKYGVDCMPRDKLAAIINLIAAGDFIEAARIYDPLCVEYKLYSYEVHHLAQHLLAQAKLPPEQRRDSTGVVELTHDNLMTMIRPGDRIQILRPNGIGREGPEYKAAWGRAVMLGPAGWVLNMGGRYGTPAIASFENIVAIPRLRYGKVHPNET